jgi:hypothetical protein
MSSDTKRTSNSGGGGRGGGGHGKKESILELAKVRERSLLGAALMLMGDAHFSLSISLYRTA